MAAPLRGALERRGAGHGPAKESPALSDVLPRPPPHGVPRELFSAAEIDGLHEGTPGAPHSSRAVPPPMRGDLALGLRPHRSRRVLRHVAATLDARWPSRALRQDTVGRSQPRTARDVRLALQTPVGW